MISKSTVRRQKRQLDTILQGYASVSNISHTDTHIHAEIALQGTKSNSDIVRINHCRQSKMYIVDIIHNEVPTNPNLRLGLANISFINNLLLTLEKLDKRSIIAQQCLSAFDSWAKSNTCI